jgi:RHS repeat-associated protein
MERFGRSARIVKCASEANDTLTAFRERRGASWVVGSWTGSLVNGSFGENGLEYRRNRYYDPQQGRFTQEDPLGLAGGMNLYGFAGGDPVNFSDPFGLTSCTPVPQCLQGLGSLREAFEGDW